MILTISIGEIEGHPVPELKELVKNDPRFKEFCENCYVGHDNYYEQLIAFSQEHPEMPFRAIFISDDDDRWIQYYLGGKVQVEDAVITFPPFDEKQLWQPTPSSQ